MTPQKFVEKWTAVQLPERAASQEHFIDLCRLLAQPTPAEHDSTGAEYAFEKGVVVSGGASKGSKGDSGYADVWWNNKFGWEYKRKGKYKDLTDAYRQLQQYREALGNPPLLIVSDITRTEIHTNFTGTVKQVHELALEDFAKPEILDKLRRVFTDPTSFKPQITVEKVTQDVAAEIGKLAINLQKRAHPPLDVAHFLMKCVFCLFAEDINLLPNKLFTKLLSRAHKDAAKFKKLASALFAEMKTGGEFGVDPIPFFNGGLFDDAEAIDLNLSDIGMLMIAAKLDWSAVEPHIFGTLFERALDPEKRSQIGAHYTSRDDIMLVVEPVILAPLRREWEAAKTKIAGHVAKRAAASKATGDKKQVAGFKREVTVANAAIDKLLGEFQGRLSHVSVLDPACGSGNFLYVSLQQLLNLEKEVIAFGAQPHIGASLLPRVRPTQLHGIEINQYAAELASVVIWIGYLQWMRDNGFVAPSNPVLEKMKNIENRDAILDLSDQNHPAPAKWPEVDFIVGNPPFLGSKVFRGSGLSDNYLDALWSAFESPKSWDLCCYWFESARRQLSRPRSDLRVGLLATQAIRSGENRRVLEAIKATGDIFAAWADKSWILDGADVRVSIVAFDNGMEKTRALDGSPVPFVNANLSSATDVTTAKPLPENADLAFMGVTLGGPFDLEWEEARRILASPNASGRRNSDVIKPLFNASEATKRWDGRAAIDFGVDSDLTNAAAYEMPLHIVETRVKPERIKNRRESYAKLWWRFVEARPALRAATRSAATILVTPRVAKHRMFIRLPGNALADSRLFVFALPTDCSYGILQSAVHEVWSLATCSWHGVGNDPTYNSKSCFETFPLPWPPGKEDVKHPAYVRIAEAAKALDEQRERWLNPPEWIDPLAQQIDAADKFTDVPKEARALVRQSAIMAAAAKDARLKKRTLTNLYNERPTWLKIAHATLDRAVLAAYAATDPAGGWDVDWAEVWTDTGAGQPLPAGHALAAKRAEVDQKVLANLLRLNHARAGRSTAHG